MKELNLIQTKLNAPKNQVNKFGGYQFRSAEDILEALKPLLAESGCTVTISDEIVEIGGRIYVKATATITNPQGESVSTSAYAREEESKKGMDAAQLTGATSSYARKYALNGLFAIDDNKDFDATNTHGKEEPAPTKPKRAVKSGASSEQVGNKSEQAEQKDGIFDSPELQDAIEAAKNAKTAEELTQVWKDWRPKFGTFHEFVNAVKSNPNHPSHKQ